MPDLILYALDQSTGVVTVTLNRPEKRNALNPELIEAIEVALTKAEQDDHVRVILLNANGKDFCAGADLGHLEETLDWSHEDLVADAMQLGNLFVHMREIPKPIVAVVHGNALAGGCGLATACDIVIAANDARFGYPEVHIGFVPAMVMTMLIRDVGEKLAFELGATGRKLGAEEANELGLVNRVVESQDLLDSAVAFARDLAQKSAAAVGAEKELLRAVWDLPLARGIELAADVNARVRTTPEARAGFRRFLQGKRSAQ